MKLGFIGRYNDNGAKVTYKKVNDEHFDVVINRDNVVFHLNALVFPQEKVEILKSLCAEEENSAVKTT